MTSCRSLPTVLIALVTVSGCATVSTVEPILPQRHRLVREQLVVHSDFALAAQHRLLEELTALRFDLARALDLPVSDEPIYVYLFEDAERFRKFIRWHHPEFADRRAFFVETDTRLVVYAHWGDRVAEDLRHEVTHGYLHSVVPALPLWLDEGLAEHFEVRRGQGGRNVMHLERLLARLKQGQWRPDLARLERLDSAFGMSLDDYAESWAWVHFLLHGRPEHRELLRRHLADLRRDGTAAPLSPLLSYLPDPGGAAVVEHLRRVAAGGRS